VAVFRKGRSPGMARHLRPAFDAHPRGVPRYAKTDDDALWRRAGRRVNLQLCATSITAHKSARQHGVDAARTNPRINMRSASRRNPAGCHRRGCAGASSPDQEDNARQRGYRREGDMWDRWVPSKRAGKREPVSIRTSSIWTRAGTATGRIMAIAACPATSYRRRATPGDGSARIRRATSSMPRALPQCGDPAPVLFRTQDRR